VSMFLLTVILARCVYPIKVSKIKREELSALLLVYITTGGDIAELFSYVDESSFVNDFNLFFFIISEEQFLSISLKFTNSIINENLKLLVSFSLSTFQYSITLVMRKKRHNHRRNDEKDSHDDNEQLKFQSFIDVLFGTKIWVILTTFLFQDSLFFIIRLTVLVQYEASTMNYTLYFFVIKNFVLCLFEMYRIFVLLCNEI
jgi:hypothetical protein